MTAERDHNLSESGSTESTQVDPAGSLRASLAVESGVEKVFHFIPSTLERQTEKRATGTRDWGGALDLIAEAAEAVRLAEERTVAAEQYNHQVTQAHKEQNKVAEARIAAAERRAKAAELRAAEAEEWLEQLHDAIVNGFKGVLNTR